ncbi:MAG: GTPase HflX [Clostridia bacterium]|nr:GTPase HflX [Clostridia bacterium]
MQDNMTEEIVNKRRALLVGVNIAGDRDFDKSFAELGSLAEANYYEVAASAFQNAQKVNKALYIGSGKADEIKEIIKNENIDIVIFNNELSPIQFKNLEEKFGKEVIDRTGLILQIFSDRAKTREAKLQVDVARLEYMLPRLSHMHSDLGRQGGGSGLSNKGSGEKRIELDRRRIEEKLDMLKKELDKLSNIRTTQRKKRAKSNIPRVALAGYTNAGKSTVLNEIIKTYNSKIINDDLDETNDNQNEIINEDNKLKTVFEKDMLFATLETATRLIDLDNNKTFFLSDTVGFIRQLPHNLIKAFRSTLEEIKEADLIVEVVDYSDPDYINHIEVTDKTLKEIGASDIPVLYVYNKSDKCEGEYPIAFNDKAYISAKETDSIKVLVDEISKRIFASHKKCVMHIPYSDGSVVSYLNDTATVYNMAYDETGTILNLELNEADYNKYKKYIMDEGE